MHLFTVTLGTKQSEQFWTLSRYLSDAFANVYQPSGKWMLEWELNELKGCITCYQVRGGRKKMSLPLELVYRLASEGCAAFILDVYERSLLQRLIYREYGEADEAVAMMTALCEKLLCQAPAIQRKEQIAAALFHFYKEEGNEVHLDGFIAFRLGAYLELLRETVEYAAEEYRREKQYQDFIGLLRYFVAMQETKLPLVHLFQQSCGSLQLLGPQFTPLEAHDTDPVVAQLLLESEMNVEDRIVSLLVAAAPEQIIVHAPNPEDQVIRTLQQIFAAKITYCLACRSSLPASETNDLTKIAVCGYNLAQQQLPET